MKFFIALSVFFGLTLQCLAQVQEVEALIRQAENGNTAAAEKGFITLKAKHGKTPEMLYLDALLSEDGNTAIKKYISLRSQFPGNKYAALAGYRLYQYNYSLGNYRSAEALLKELQASHPGMTFQPLPANSQKGSTDTGKSQNTPLPKKDSDSKTRFLIKLGVFANKENAEKLIIALRKDGYSQNSIKTSEKLFGGQPRYVVIISGFNSLAEAEKISDTIARKYNLQPSVQKQE